MAGSPAYLLITPSDYLTFTQEENKPDLKSSLKVTNQSTLPVAFKIKTTAPKQYTVQPNKGLLEPNASLVVSVSATSKVEVDATHKFQIIAVQTKLASDPIPEDVWKSSKSQTTTLLAKASLALEFQSSRSISMMTNQSIVRDALADAEEDEGLKSECEELKRIVEGLNLKVKAMGDGLSIRKSSQVVKVAKTGFTNTHVVIFFLLGVLLSLALKYKGSS